MLWVSHWINHATYSFKPADSFRNKRVFKRFIQSICSKTLIYSGTKSHNIELSQERHAKILLLCLDLFSLIGNIINASLKTSCILSCCVKAVSHNQSCCFSEYPSAVCKMPHCRSVILLKLFCTILVCWFVYICIVFRAVNLKRY